MNIYACIVCTDGKYNFHRQFSSPRSTLQNHAGLVKINGKLLTSSWWKISENLLFSKDKRRKSPLFSFHDIQRQQVKIVYKKRLSMTTWKYLNKSPRH